MKYLCLVYGEEKALANMPDEHCVAFDAQVRKSGHCIASEALQPASTATTVRVRNGKVSVTDGPFAETKEALAGFYMIEARDLNEAIQIAARIPPAEVGSIEVRPIRPIREQFKPFVLSTLVDAPRDVVWRAWTEPERLKRWWGPKGFTVHTCKVDLRRGGVFHYGMKTPDGKDVWGRFVYSEIRAPERLQFVVSFSDPQGGVTRHPWNANWPLQMLSTVEFAPDCSDRTKVTVHWTPHEASEVERKTFDEGRESMKQGWTGTFEQFGEYLKSAVTA